MLDSMKEYILLQRTGINPEDVESGFKRSLERDFNMFKMYLPESLSSVLDIGCGLGGIDLLIYEYYNPRCEVNLHLFDKTEKKDIFYGFNQEYCFYNDLGVAKDFLILNGVNPKNIVTYEVGEASPFIKNNKYDLIISLVSWGFHYPISKYILEVAYHIQDDGLLILDIRKGVSGEAELQNYFEDIQIIESHRKYNTYKCTKKIM
ncbi:hypothetical protein ACN4EW_30010 [Arthrospira platensis CENA650]